MSPPPWGECFGPGLSVRGRCGQGAAIDRGSVDQRAGREAGLRLRRCLLLMGVKGEDPAVVHTGVHGFGVQGLPGVAVQKLAGGQASAFVADEVQTVGRRVEHAVVEGDQSAGGHAGLPVGQAGEAHGGGMVARRHVGMGGGGGYQCCSETSQGHDGVVGVQAVFQRPGPWSVGFGKAQFVVAESGQESAGQGDDAAQRGRRRDMPGGFHGFAKLLVGQFVRMGIPAGRDFRAEPPHGRAGAGRERSVDAAFGNAPVRLWLFQVEDVHGLAAACLQNRRRRAGRAFLVPLVDKGGDVTEAARFSCAARAGSGLRRYGRTGNPEGTGAQGVRPARAVGGQVQVGQTRPGPDRK